ncbi:MAG: hypothetical protein E7Z87_03480 [Cyanobacteria bacterium SIG26]|nr:hypothetical protein [Cyanobacteria bacterium SIG26]
MIINNLTYHISFQSNRRSYKAGPLKETIYTQTDVNRDDLSFKELANIMFELYKKEPKINIYCVACSDGSEPYTITMQLKEHTPKEFSQKCLPIIATDIDPTILRCANSKRLNMTQEDIESLKKDGIDYTKYFEPANKKMYIMNDNLDGKTTTYLAKDNIKDDIIFEKKTILQQGREITNEYPNVFSCRNVLEYIGDDDEQVYYIQQIGKKLAKGDLFLIGDFDRGIRNIRTLQNMGFKEISKNIFVKTI